MSTISGELTRALRLSGAALVGFADLAEVPADTRQNLPRGIAIAVALDPDIILGIADGPTRDYYDEYLRANRKLASLAEQATAILTDRGYHALSDPPTDSSPVLPHKTVATRAGLGWIGKCALLVTREYGSAVRLTSVLTDAPLDTARPVNDSRCGTCAACLEACPGHAVLGPNWTVDTPREKIYSADLCRQTARNRALQGFGVDYTICGKCIEICPWTRRYLEQTP